MNFFDPEKNRFIRAVFPFCAAVGAASFYMAMRNDFEADIAHFARGSVPFIICVVFTILAAVLSCVTYFATKNHGTLEEVKPGMLLTTANLLTAVSSVAVFVTGLTDLRINVMTGSGSISMLSADKLEVLCVILTPAVTVSAILSVIERTRNTAIHTFFCILTMLYFNLKLFAGYFDFSTAINGPVRNYVSIILSAVLLFSFSEARISFGKRENRSTYAYSFFASSLCASITLGISTAMLLYRATCPTTINDPTPSIYSCALYFAVSLTALARLISLKPKKETVPETSTEKGDTQNG